MPTRCQTAVRIRQGRNQRKRPRRKTSADERLELPGGHHFDEDIPALAALIGKNPDLAGEIKEWHELAGTLGYWLIGLHAAAALFHHFISRDNTFIRMLPGRN